jgi:hypothetical protein
MSSNNKLNNSSNIDNIRGISNLSHPLYVVNIESNSEIKNPMDAYKASKGNKKLRKVYFKLSEPTHEPTKEVYSYSYGSVLDKQSTNHRVSLKKLFEVITSAPLSPHKILPTLTTQYVEANEQKKSSLSSRIREQKLKLPYILISGHQNQGHTKKDITYNGAIQIDIDLKEINGNKEALRIKKALSNLPFIALCSVSPSSYGVKAIVQTSNRRKSLHSHYSKAISLLISELCNIDYKHFDNVNCSQPCFIPNDKETFLNTNAKEIGLSLHLNKEEYSDFTILIKGKKQIKGRTKPTFKPSNSTTKEYLSTELGARACKIALTIGLKSESKGTIFFRDYATACNSFGVKISDCIKWINNTKEAPTPEEKNIKTIYEIYDRYSHQFKNNEFRLFDKNTLPFPKYTLEKNQKLSQIDLHKEFLRDENFQMIAPTGSGKGYLVANAFNFKRVLIVPTQGLVREIAEKYGASAFFQDATSLINLDFICTTYKSLPRLTEKIDISEYVAFKDESHNTVSAGYIVKDLTKVLSILPQFKNYHLITGTALKCSHPIFKTLKTINVVESDPVKKQFNFLYYEKERNKAILSHVLKNKDLGKQTAILFNNTKDESGKLHDILQLFKRSKIKYATINSTTKHTEEFQQVVVNGDMRDFDVVISTTVLKEGTSITEHSKNVNCLIVGSFHPCTIEQFSARFRRVEKREVTILKNKEKQKEESYFRLEKESKTLLIEQDFIKNTIQSVLNTTSLSTTGKQNLIKAWTTLNTNCIDVIDNTPEINPLRHDNILHERETTEANKDSLFMSTYLKETYNWIELDYTSFKGKTDKREQEAIKLMRKANKERLFKFHEKALLDYMDGIVPIEKESPSEKKIRRDIKTMFEYLAPHYLNDKQKIFELIKAKEINTALKYENLKRQIKISHAKNVKENKSIPISVWINEISSELKKHTNITGNGIQSIIDTANKKIGKISDKRASFKIAKSFCDLKLRKSKELGTYYEIISHDPAKLVIEIPEELERAFSSHSSKKEAQQINDSFWEEMSKIYNVGRTP